MKLLHRILRRGHCHGTHQNFALDAIPLVQTAAGKRLITWLMRYYHRYLRGAIDPDIRIRDYQNQVIHVQDGFWGGAPRVAHQWYDRLQRYLRQQRYSDAAHAAGVLSHYFTDPIHPLNTAYSAAEAVIHRPLQWSIDRDYDTIMRHWQADELRVVFEFSDGPGWLGAAMLHSAKYANQRFDTLVRSYRLDAALEDPAAGLNPHLRLVVAELFGLAITGWARVIERAAQDAESLLRRPLPTAPTAWPTMTAALRVAGTCWRNRIKSQLEDLQIQALVEEFRETGDLQKHLPAAVDIKRRVIKVYRQERLYQREQERRRADDLAYRLGQQIPGVISTRGRSVDCLAIDSRDLARLKAAQIETFDDLQSAPAIRVAKRMNAYWITPATIVSWQLQASLISRVAGLDATAAMILVEAGINDPAAITRDQHAQILRQVLRFLNTVSGRRCLRGRPQPTTQQIATWLQLMQAANPIGHSTSLRAAA